LVEQGRPKGGGAIGCIALLRLQPTRIGHRLERQLQVHQRIRYKLSGGLFAGVRLTPSAKTVGVRDQQADAGQGERAIAPPTGVPSLCLPVILVTERFQVVSVNIRPRGVGRQSVRNQLP
jgi:hypothetical protein